MTTRAFDESRFNERPRENVAVSQMTSSAEQKQPLTSAFGGSVKPMVSDGVETGFVFSDKE